MNARYISSYIAFLSVSKQNLLLLIPSIQPSTAPEEGAQVIDLEDPD